VGQTHAFSYSNLYELTQETHPDPAIGTTQYTYNVNGNRQTRTQNGVTDCYGVTADNRLLWVNRGTNAAPTAGQANPYTLFSYNTNGLMSQRDRRHDGGLRQVQDLLWDEDDRLRSVTEGGTTRFSALRNGDGLRVRKTDTRAGVLQDDDFRWGPGGLGCGQEPPTRSEGGPRLSGVSCRTGPTPAALPQVPFTVFINAVSGCRCRSRR
jgi:YD repeat-containing protein